MSRMMIVVEFEDKPKHRNQFIELMRGHAQRSGATFVTALCFPAGPL